MGRYDFYTMCTCRKFLKLKQYIYLKKIKKMKKSLVESKEDQPFLMMCLAENILDTELNCGLTVLVINMST